MKPNTLIVPLILLSLTLTVSSVRAQGLGSLVSPAPEATEDEATTEETPETKPAKAPAKPSPKPLASVPQPTASVAKVAASPTATATVSASPSAAKPPIVADANMVQKIAQAGIQFEVPKGWQFSEVAGPSGPTYRLISKDGAGFFFVTTIDEEVAARLAAMREAVEKSAKKYKAGTDKENMINGLKYSARADSVDDGASVSITGYVQGKAPVIFMRAGEAAPMKANAAALDGIFASVKKMD